MKDPSLYVVSPTLNEAYAETVAELKAELARLREQYAVPEDERPTGPCVPNESGAPIRNQ